MAIIRGPDGKPIGDGEESNEATTRKVEKRSIKERVAAKGDAETGPTPVSEPEPAGGGEPAPQQAAPPAAGAGGDAGAGGGGSAGGAGSGGGGSAGADDAPATQIVGGRRRGAEKVEQPTSSSPGSSTLKDPMEDPVVGWVVVVAGPGQGASLTLGYGMNSIGRAPTERICLDFGDGQISRTQHANITYDPRGRKYFIHHGGGKNLTYMGDEPVLTPIELQGGEEVMIGDTTLRFVPFCGKDFDWRDR